MNEQDNTYPTPAVVETNPSTPSFWTRSEAMVHQVFAQAAEAVVSASSLSRRVDELSIQVSTLQNTLNDLMAERSDLRRQVHDLTEENEALIEENKRVEASWTYQKELTLRAQQELAEAEETIRRLKEEVIPGLETKVEEANIERDLERENAVSWERKHSEVSSEYQAAQERWDGQSKDKNYQIADLEQKVADLEETNAKLRDRLDGVMSHVGTIMGLAGNAARSAA